MIQSPAPDPAGDLLNKIGGLGGISRRLAAGHYSLDDSQGRQKGIFRRRICFRIALRILFIIPAVLREFF